jgi:NAD(P)-dependent dehydrogenase (short-subunit alcohol dehydrogenase family)
MPMADVSDVVAFLCSNASEWITGTALPVDAGFLLK